MILCAAVFTLFFVNRLVNSGIGISMQTVRFDEIAAVSIGINPTKFKMIAFITAAFFAGIAGSFYAMYISFISPDTFVYNDSSTVLAMVVLGGLASVPGAVIGVIFLILAPEFLRFMSDYRMFIFGILMVVMMIFKPSGIWGEDKRTFNLYKKWAEKK
jgi:branched-chain amino acid transport system permease protein